MKLRSTFSLLALLGLLTACNTTEPVVEDETNEEQVVVDEDSLGTPFVSNELGFELTLPESWEVTTSLEETTWAFGTAQTLYFKKADTLTDIFAVTRFTTEEWAEVEGANMPVPTVLEENDDYVWVYDRAQDPADVEAYHEELPKVLESFQVIE